MDSSLQLRLTGVLTLRILKSTFEKKMHKIYAVLKRNNVFEAQKSYRNGKVKNKLSEPVKFDLSARFVGFNFYSEYQKFVFGH